MYLFPGCDRINCLIRNNTANTDVVTINTTNVDGVITASAPLEEQSKYIYIHICLCMNTHVRVRIYLILLNKIYLLY